MMSDIEIAQHATMRPIIELAKEQYGIWGATSPKERQRIRNPKAA